MKFMSIAILALFAAAAANSAGSSASTNARRLGGWVWDKAALADKMAPGRQNQRLDTRMEGRLETRLDTRLDPLEPQKAIDTALKAALDDHSRNAPR